MLAIEDQPSTSSAAPHPTEEPQAALCEDHSSSREATNTCPPSGSESCSEPELESSSSSQDYQPTGITNTMYFEDSKPSSDQQRWLCGFYNYLTLPDAGHKKKAQRLQHASQMKLLLEVMALDDNFECLGEDNGDSVWLWWVEKHLQAQTNAPGTLASYLTSMQMFLTYITSRKYGPQPMPPLSPSLKQTFMDLILAL